MSYNDHNIGLLELHGYRTKTFRFSSVVRAIKNGLEITVKNTTALSVEMLYDIEEPKSIGDQNFNYQGPHYNGTYFQQAIKNGQVSIVDEDALWIRYNDQSWGLVNLVSSSTIELKTLAMGVDSFSLNNFEDLRVLC